MGKFKWFLLLVFAASTPCMTGGYSVASDSYVPEDPAARPSLFIWSATTQRGGVSCRPCRTCSGPSGVQINEAREVINGKCGKPGFDMLLEGWDDRFYVWIFKCRSAPPPPEP